VTGIERNVLLELSRQNSVFVEALGFEEVIILGRVTKARRSHDTSENGIGISVVNDVAILLNLNSTFVVEASKYNKITNC
jgi:hypothetical protein